ncbi:DUF1232 domain-containing protein [Devosia neptuniae]|jgi:uncharacterized membrane protein YkvA (DUF1232 family)|uniref:DUF1232 domain-containing protein n=1 Tax=Devosia neptuniae TaxID=191302 RepID=A0ABY6CHJ5_9HYPH|nr:DUF1232 domain-containing protein [Devosia neptuniae]UXN71635.1 DUF1232 domain-containing protein [Devosia neptuniae]
MFKLLTSRFIPRIMLFRKEALLLWKALFAPETPLHLKAATLFVAFYLVNPIDIIPDFIPLAGWMDDLILVPLMVSWIVSRLPVPVRADMRERNDQTINGRARRL